MTIVFSRSILWVVLVGLFFACQPEPKPKGSDVMGMGDDTLTDNFDKQDDYVQQNVLTAEDYSVRISTSGQSMLKKLELRLEDASGQPAFNKEVVIDGIVMGSFMADLNGDGWQEVYVFNQSAGSGSYVQMIAYQIENGRMDSIELEDIKGPIAGMYMGHDSFSVNESSLSRFFPLYHELDPNCCPTGGMHRIDYHLISRNNKFVLVEKPSK